MSKRMVVATLALVGAFIALYLTLFKFGVVGTLQCSIGSCETVNTSRWSFFAGMPVAAWGVAFYVAVLFVAMLGIQERFAERISVSKALLWLTGWGVLFSLYLTGLELFVIHAICIWCVTSAVIVTLMFAASVMDYREVRQIEGSWVSME